MVFAICNGQMETGRSKILIMLVLMNTFFYIFYMYIYIKEYQRVLLPFCMQNIIFMKKWSKILGSPFTS